MGLTQILSTALDGLNAQSAGLSTTGDNIANVNTPGYARRELQLFIRRMHVWGALATSGGEPSDAVKALVREQVLLVTDRYIRDGRPEMAREIVTWARLDQTFRTMVAFSPEELDRLEMEIAKAEAARPANR